MKKIKFIGIIFLITGCTLKQKTPMIINYNNPLKYDELFELEIIEEENIYLGSESKESFKYSCINNCYIFPPVNTDYKKFNIWNVGTTEIYIHNVKPDLKILPNEHYFFSFIDGRWNIDYAFALKENP